MDRRILIFVLGVVLFFSRCKNEGTDLNLKGNPEAVAFLEEALTRSNNLYQWNNLDTLEFLKKTEMFYPDSSLEMSVFQRQKFSNNPVFYGEITYLEDSLERRIVQEEEKVRYFENGNEILDTEQVAKAATNIQIAYYVTALPYKLNDEGVIIESISDTLLDNGIKAKSIQVQHINSDGGVKDEKWWVYFDPETYDLLGYLIEHDHRHSLILNDSNIFVEGFSFPVERKSYYLDENRENRYLRAHYEYSNYELK